MSIGLIGWLVMCFSSLLFVPPPPGTLSLNPPPSTCYLDYQIFQIYTNFAVIGMYLVGIGLFGFFVRFRNSFFLIASLSSFLATIQICRCKLYPDWRLPSSGYTINKIAAFDSLFLTATFLVILAVLFVGLGFFKMKKRPESIDIPAFCILVSSSYGLFIVLVNFVLKITDSLSLSSALSGLDSAYALCIMFVGYFFILVISGKEYSWIFKFVKPEPRTKEKYWW
jgi:hypothetical protein